MTIGLNWLVSAIHIKFPWSSHAWACPFLTILMPPEKPLSSSKNKKDLSNKKPHKTLNDWACQCVRAFRKWLGASIKLTLVADSSFATYKLANTCIDLGVTLISRLRLDARLFSFPPEKLMRGRKRLVGTRLPTLNETMNDPNHEWISLEVTWYGGKKKEVLVLTGICLWYAYGIPPVKIRWVLIKDPKGEVETIALFSTNRELTPKEIIEPFVERWQLEVTFEEARRHLGIETQRQWSDGAIDRITPCLFASFSIINLLALEMAKTSEKDIPVQRTSWYKKDHTTFSDILTYIRTNLLREKYFLGFKKKQDIEKNSLEELVLRLIAA